MPARLRDAALTRTLRSALWHREHLLFLVIGASVAGFGRILLGLLLTAGWAAGLANATQFVVTLQLNFLANRGLTWRRRTGLRFWRCWWRFQVARSSSALLCLTAFPVLATVAGISVAYWGLTGTATLVNLCSDRFWSFSPTRRATAAARPAPRHRRADGRTGPDSCASRPPPASGRWRRRSSTRSSSPSRCSCSSSRSPRWRSSSTSGGPRRTTTRAATANRTTPGCPASSWSRCATRKPSPRTPLQRLATLNHPDYRVVPVVDHPDDPGTAAIAHDYARRYPDRVLVCRYPEDTDVHNKPIGLNAAVEMLKERGVPFEWVGVADAEDLFHPDLLRMADYRLRRAGAGIVQCGVQLMNFSADPRTLPPAPGWPARVRRWWRANTSGWWRAANVAVYVLGFQFFQAFVGLMAPLALALALYHKSPIVVALLATLPLALNLLAVVLDVVLLAQFGRTFREKVRLRDYAGLVLGFYPYQVTLSVAAVWALARFLSGRGNWVKTTHQGAHLRPARAAVPRRRTAEVPA